MNDHYSPASGDNSRAMTRGGRAAALAAVLAAVLAVTLAGASLWPARASGASRVRAGVGVYRLDAIPARYLGWYRAAARTCPGLAWEVLAGIGTMESDNGRSRARGVHRGKNRKGAEGPMQFEPPTFAEYAVRADRSAKLSPYNPADAIFSAARMLCADGARGGSRRGLRAAIFAYNHAHWYVRDVLAIAAEYTAAEHAAARQAAARHAAARRKAGHARAHHHRRYTRHRGRAPHRRHG